MIRLQISAIFHFPSIFGPNKSGKKFFWTQTNVFHPCLFVLVDGKVKQIDYAATPYKVGIP